MKKILKTKFFLLFILSFVLSLPFILSNSITAKALSAPSSGNEYAYLFKDGKYVLYDLTVDKQIEGFPAPVDSRTWPGLPWTTIDAAFTSPSNKNQGFIFKGNQYVSYDYAKDRVDPGYPKAINNTTWPGLPFSSVDAIVPSNNGKVFFIKGNQYARFDMYTDRVDSGYPKAFNSSTWPGVPWTSIDSAVTASNNLCYLFKGNQYIRYDLNTDKAVSGVLSISGNWSGLSFTSGIKGALTVGNPYLPTSAKRDKVVYEVKKHIGKPYVWGATGPNSFDCSGLTQYSYRYSLGMEIGRTTYDQINSGREVLRSELQPGDLIFTRSDLGHVQLYIGNGRVIHAPEPGRNVEETSIYNFYRARRIIN